MADNEQVTLEERLENLVKQTNAALRDQIKLEADLSRFRGQKVSAAEQEIATRREEVRLARELGELLDANSERSKKLIETYKNQLVEEQKVGKITASNYQNQMRTLDEISSIQEQILKHSTDDTDEGKQKLVQYKKQLELLKQILASQAKVSEAMVDGVRAGSGLVETLTSFVGLKTDLDQGIVGNLMRSVTETKSLGSALLGVKSSFEELFGLGNIMGFLAKNMADLVVQVDKLSSSLVATTTASRDNNEVFLDAFRLNKQLGVTINENAEAYGFLFDSFQRFSGLSKSSQTELVALASAYEKLGVDARTFGENMNFLVSSLGETVPEAASTLKSFATVANQTGIPVSELQTQFKTLQKDLGAFGKEAPTIFLKTAKAAKSLGMEVGELGQNLFQLSSGLDTFDQAASKVASFNLVMGGSFVNTFDLVMAAAEGPFAQLEMLRQGFDNAGRSFEDMNFFEQKMLADSFGISIGNLRAMMEGTMDAEQAFQTEQDKFNELVDKASSVIDKLHAAVQGLSGGLQFFDKVFGSVGGTIAAGLTGILTGFAALRLSFFILSKTTFGQTMQTVAQGMQAAAVAAQQQAAANAGLAVATEASGVSQAQKTIITDLDTKSQIMNNASKEKGFVLATNGLYLTPQTIGAMNAETAAKELNTLKQDQNTFSKKVAAGATDNLTRSTIGLGFAMSAVSAAMGVFMILQSLNLSGTERTIARLAAALATLGIIIAAVRGAFGDFSAAARGIAAGIAFGSFVYAVMPEGTGATGTMGGGTGPARSFTTPTEMTIPASPVDTQVPGFQSGGDNITTPFIMNEGPRPSAELTTPTSVLKSQDSINLTNSLKDTAKALNNTRKTDGQFDKMVQMLEKIAGNTAQAPNQQPQNINVTAEFNERGFRKMVARAVNSEMGI